MKTKRIDIILSKPNKSEKIIETNNYYIEIREDLVWKDGKITEVPLVLKKNEGNNNSYKLFHMNFCLESTHCNECEGNDTIQIHVSKARLQGRYHYDYKPSIPISLIPNKKEIFVEVLEYDYKNPQDNLVLECGTKTDIPVPFFINSVSYFGIDPQPERKGKSILVGKT
jgi:hypothetical protein